MKYESKEDIPLAAIRAENDEKKCEDNINTGEKLLMFLKWFFFLITFRYTCEYCDEKFPSKASRRSHEKSNHVDEEGQLLQIDCKECEKKLPTSTHLRKHVSDRHGSKNKVCTSYPAEFQKIIC